MSFTILTHDRVKVANAAGVLGKEGLLTGTGAERKLFGGNAIQSITIGRHTPKNPQQAVGYLGIVDYTSGVVTSDVSVDCVIVEGCSKADTSTKRNSVYRYSEKNVDLSAESYVLTSVGVTLQAGSPASMNVGYMCSGLASYLDVQDQPDPSDGEESDYAIVLGDDGSGISLDCTWDGNVPVTAHVPYINASGALVSNSLSDSGLPAGVQNLTMSASINRDQVLDVRSASPIQFVTTYPLDFSASMEVYCLPHASGQIPPGVSGYDPVTFRNSGGHAMRKLLAVAVTAKNFNKHRTTGGLPNDQKASNGDVYAKMLGVELRDESEAISVGRYLSYTFQFTLADILMPLPKI